MKQATRKNESLSVMARALLYDNTYSIVKGDIQQQIVLSHVS